jgi:hypothetical protein
MKRVTMLLAMGLALFAAAVPTIRAIGQQKMVTADSLDQAITEAKTAADHEAIAAYYEGQAEDTKKKANLHRRTAEAYRKSGMSKQVYTAEMCDKIAAMWDKIAADQEKLAMAHREMAKKAETQRNN